MILNSKTILITGAAGFIGSHLYNRLSSLGAKCIGIDNFNEYYDVNLKKNRVKHLLNLNKMDYVFDICEKEKLFEVFKNNKIDIVVHLAAQAGVRYSLENPEEYVKTNIFGSFQLLETIKEFKVEHFLFSSTSSVYGYQEKNIFFEYDKADYQLSLYASTKKSVESLIHNYAYNFGLNSTIFRFFTVYGPWGRPDMALFKFVKAILDGKPIDVYNNGHMWRDFTYIDDLINSIIDLIKIKPLKKIHPSDSLSPVAPFRIVNIGRNSSIKLSNFIKIIEENLNKKAKQTYLPIQPGDVKSTLADTSLLKKLTQNSPSVDIHEGVDKFIKWYLHYFNE